MCALPTAASRRAFMRSRCALRSTGSNSAAAGSMPRSTASGWPSRSGTSSPENLTSSHGRRSVESGARSSGYDQAELLCKAVSRALDVPMAADADQGNGQSRTIHADGRRDARGQCPRRLSARMARRPFRANGACSSMILSPPARRFQSAAACCSLRGRRALSARPLQHRERTRNRKGNHHETDARHRASTSGTANVLVYEEGRGIGPARTLGRRCG